MKVTVYKHKNTESGALLAWVLPVMEKPLAEIYETKPGVYLVLSLSVGWYIYHRKICTNKRTAIRNAENAVRIETPLVRIDYAGAEVEIVPAG